MLVPKKVKHRKWQSGRKSVEARKKVETRGTTVSFGSFAIKATSQARIESKQIESARKAMQRSIGKTGRIWIRIFPDRPFTQKGAGVGMGKGKGSPEGYCVEVGPGRIMFEVDGVTEAIAREGLRKAGTKLPVKTRVVARD